MSSDFSLDLKCNMSNCTCKTDFVGNMSSGERVSLEACVVQFHSSSLFIDCTVTISHLGREFDKKNYSNCCMGI